MTTDKMLQSNRATIAVVNKKKRNEMRRKIFQKAKSLGIKLPDSWDTKSAREPLGFVCTCGNPIKICATNFLREATEQIQCTSCAAVERNSRRTKH